MDDISPNASRQKTAESIAEQVRLRRRQRGISASELARSAGLSKATLSAVEAGSGNPTVETLDAIAIALRIPLTDLLTSEQPVEAIVRHRESHDPDVPSQELLQRLGAGRAVEVWRLTLPADSSLDGVPHSPGTIEHILVNAGSFEAGPVGDQRPLATGDFFLFMADLPHRYTTGHEAVDATVIMASPLSV
jgi:transcriptional regulator with XRE-family HTH domain